MGKMQEPSINHAEQLVQKYAAWTANSVQVSAHSRCIPCLDLHQGWHRQNWNI